MRLLSRLAAASALLLVGGCAGGSDGDAPTAGLTPSPPASAAPSVVSPSESAALAELAEQAESAAKEATKTPSSGLDEPVVGADISWPQCPAGLGIPERQTEGMPMPFAEAEFVIIGLTNGPGFHPNPCLADQVAWARESKLATAAYAVASYPTKADLRRHGDDGPFGSTRRDRLRNAGYQQALFNLETMTAAGLSTPILWVDVEPVSDFEWSTRIDDNVAVVEGLVRGYADRDMRIGVYSTPHLWERIVGDLQLGVPEWRAAGETSRKEALARCSTEWVIQGGEAVFGQWVAERRDHNVTCPGVTSLTPWFHQY